MSYRGVASFLVMAASLAQTGTLVQAAEWQVSTVLADLDSPRGVAVQPETDQVYVCDTGRGRVLRIADGKAVEVVVGLPVNRAAETLRGPMSLVFLDAKVLLVGGGGLPDAEDGLYAFSMPDPGAPPVSFDAAIVIGPLPKSDQPAEGDFGSLSVSRLGILAASQGETAQGWIARLEIKDSEPPIRSESFGTLSRFLDAGAAVPVRGAACVTVSPRGEIVVGHMGRQTQDGDSWLSLFRATDQKRLLTLETGLHDLVGLIYSSATSPVTDPQLYAIDAGGSRPEQGGLFRLDAALKEGRQAITPTKLASLQRPTAIARGPGNAFYVTLLGPNGTQDAIAKTGQLVRIALAP